MNGLRRKCRPGNHHDPYRRQWRTTSRKYTGNNHPTIAASDGAGVKLRRSIGASPFLRHDPFLMLDEFLSDDPDDYLAGFPAHSHRGFETVTYMLDGHMRHEDNHGNQGDLGPDEARRMIGSKARAASARPGKVQPQ